MQTDVDIFSQANSLFDPENLESRIGVANFLLAAHGNPQRCVTYGDAVVVLQSILQNLLAQRRYRQGAALCWGPRLFDPRPRFVKQIWRCLMTKSKALIMGCGSGGKSYTTMGFALLDWSFDPLDTTTKIISTTAGHARAQTFSTLVRFHRSSAVPLPGFIRQGFIGLDKDDRRSSISEVAIEEGAQGKGAKLQGFHPLPRIRPHPILGTMSRVNAILDEAEAIPIGVWEGVNNMLTTRGWGDSVRVVGLTNPRDRSSPFAQRAEPINGWRDFDIDTSLSWESKMGWHVERLDGAQCENVIAKKVIFPGLIDYDGYMEREIEGGADYYTFARGAYPTQAIAYNIVPPYLLDNATGTFTWSKTPVPIGTLDPAFEEEGDKAIFTAGKYGEALGITPPGGTLKLFPQPRWVIQVDQQFQITKQNTDLMCKDVISICRTLHIRPEWFAIDRSGNATGLCDLLKIRFGKDVLGLQWGQDATEVPIVEEDTQPANELYDNLVTEMYFCFSRWLEYGYIAFAPVIQTAELFTQLTARRYRPIGKIKRRIDSKKDYKKNTGKRSPDESDSLVMMVHLCRLRDELANKATMVSDKKASEPPPPNYIEEGKILSVQSQTEADKFDFIHSR